MTHIHYHRNILQLPTEGTEQAVDANNPAIPSRQLLSPETIVNLIKR